MAKQKQTVDDIVIDPDREYVVTGADLVMWYQVAMQSDRYSWFMSVNRAVLRGPLPVKKATGRPAGSKNKAKETEPHQQESSDEGDADGTREEGQMGLPGPEMSTGSQGNGAGTSSVL